MIDRPGKIFYEFEPFRVDVAERLLLRDGEMVPLTPKAFDTLLILVENSGHVVEKEELMKRLWPDTFVEEANLAHHISLLRKTFEVGANGSKYIQTVPRRGYRFVANAKCLKDETADVSSQEQPDSGEIKERQASQNGRATTAGTRATALLKHPRRTLVLTLTVFVVAVAVTGYLFFSRRQGFQTRKPPQRELVPLTSGGGLQSNPTWSPDGRWIAYSSDRSGNYDIWVQSLGAGKPIQVTNSSAHDWQPDWSPDGNNIVFRSERGGGGLFVVPALGGSEVKISSFGVQPRWSPDGSQILFLSTSPPQVLGPTGTFLESLYVVGLDGNPPREILGEFVKGFRFRGRIRGVGWHPDGQRISILGVHSALGSGFWTVSVNGGAPIKSEYSAEVTEQLKTATSFTQFSWSPSGKQLYLQGVSRDVRNIFRVTVDPQTLRWLTGPERITTGQGQDIDIAVSPDGHKLAYAAITISTRIWSLSFDAVAGRVKGEGEPMTAAGLTAQQPALSHDGKRLAFVVRRATDAEVSAARRAGKDELWEKSLEDGNERLLKSDDFFRSAPQWSPDGRYLAYGRYRPIKPDGGEYENTICLLPTNGGDEQLLISATPGARAASDWSADGQWILATLPHPTSRAAHQISLLPVSAAPRAEVQARVLISDPDYSLWHAHFSPDQRWILFQGVNVNEKVTEPSLSTIYVAPAAGGDWIHITDGKTWDDKPRWSPDGKTIYFASTRSTGFVNVWGIRFDSLKGKTVSEPFQVTAFERPGQMIFPGMMALLQISLTENRLVVPMPQISGSIWILENVDR
jgi:Tol biopolymer transport system component/DNA-binding winged helix-turn-helix (wHTH) protein